MKRLIVNADDFGLHEAINRGIIQGFRQGIVTSASLMCSAPAFADGVRLAEENPALGVGIHLTLVGGVKTVLPKTKLKTLVDDNGNLPRNYIDFSKRFYSGSIRKSEIEAELRAQIEKALDCGIGVTHVDSHQHTHALPGLAALVLSLCNEYNISRIRVPRENILFRGGFSAGFSRYVGRSGLSLCASLLALKAAGKRFAFPGHFFGMLAGGNMNEDLVGRIIASLPEGISELMVHPGLNQEVLQQEFCWSYRWAQELQACISEANKCLIKKHKIKLINFGDIADE